MDTPTKIGQGKSIFLVMPNHVNFYDTFVHQIEQMGFTVTLLKTPKFKYKNILEKSLNFFKKNVMQDKSYKESMVKQETKQILSDITKNLTKRIDYALFIRADLFEDEIIETVKKHCNIMINYQWDGMDRFPEIFNKIHFFDKFFVFDKNDIEKYPEYNFHLSNNFYFDLATDISNDGNAYFLGAHMTERVSTVINFLDAAQAINLNTNFYIGNARQSKRRSLYQGRDIVFLSEDMSYHDNLQKAKNCYILVDFVIGEHSGLSFRSFESIAYKKKLITTNSEVLNYDFYHPNNIFIWDGKTINHESLKDFLKKPYYDIDDNIRNKYSFENWLNNILEI
ncbi:MAG: hypothetical protein Q4G13_04570 [Moraxella sp.]|nr:hypothetical protein [Moraxella sp.]